MKFPALLALFVFSIVPSFALAQNAQTPAAGGYLPADSGLVKPAPAPAPAATKSADALASPCLLVKHKGTIGRRLVWFALIGVPIAPGSKYDYVDSVNFKNSKFAYGGNDLLKFQADGVRVLVLENKYAAADLDSARAACRTEAQP